jgi:hypothetical protein
MRAGRFFVMQVVMDRNGMYNEIRCWCEILSLCASTFSKSRRKAAGGVYKP